MIFLALLAAQSVTLNAKVIVSLKEGGGYGSPYGLFAEQPPISRQPDPSAIDAAFASPSAKWLYAKYQCRAVSRAGRLKGCVIAPSTPEVRKVSRRGLPLVRSFSIPEADAKRLAPHVESVSLDVEVRFSGVLPSGECAEHGFCTLTPPPPSG